LHPIPCSWISTAEGAVEERSEEMLGLTQGLSLHHTQTIHLLHKGRELLLKVECVQVLGVWIGEMSCQIASDFARNDGVTTFDKT
jgi:hypothetical protein